MHNLKIIEEFLGETKSSTAAYIDVREEQRGVSTTKLPIRLGYARGLIFERRVVYPSATSLRIGLNISVIARRRSAV
ncbi:palindromic element RPE1 domain-containing protein [Candidatus Tisiphia endosymbiont of Beris chalybata]|uniref:palindromic element RPE1 domain-containing protein n=1 Tax=Candidatus Tisiphia endosymbiont of Beris chalybata TaxID=3066262 RepID=UPI00312C6CC9